MSILITLKRIAYPFFSIEGKIDDSFFGAKLLSRPGPSDNPSGEAFSKEIEFRFFREGDSRSERRGSEGPDGDPLRPHFYLPVKEKDGAALIKFLEENVPDSINETLLVKIVLREAINYGFLVFSSLIHDTPWDGKGKPGDRLISIRNKMITYFVLSLGFSFPVLEVMIKYLNPLKVKIKRE